MAEWDGVRTAHAIAVGEVSSAEVIDAAIARAESVDGQLRALTTPTFATARALADEPGTGYLAGVPTVVKDLSEWKGHRTTFGTRASGRFISRRTTPEVSELLATGLIPIGKSAAPEHGMVPTAEPIGFPPTCNPWNTDHSTGGSSSGSAALVAAGVVPIGHATDGGGSIRIPASCCGVIGLKPSDRRMADIEGNREMPVHLLCNSVLTRTMRDTAAYVAAVEEYDPSPVFPPVGHVTEPGPQPLHVAVVATSTIATVSTEVQDVTRRTGDALSDLGHRVTEIRMPYDERQLADDFLLYWGLLASTLPAVDRRVMGRSADTSLFDPWTKGLAVHARRNAVAVPGAIRRLLAARRMYANLMSRYHVLLNPTVATTAPRLGWLDVTLPFEELCARLYAFTPFAAMFNVTGVPAISLPMGIGERGLPIGIQLAAGPGEERVLIELGLALEDAVGFNALRA